MSNSGCILIRLLIEDQEQYSHKHLFQLKWWFHIYVWH